MFCTDIESCWFNIRQSFKNNAFYAFLTRQSKNRTQISNIKQKEHKWKIENGIIDLYDYVHVIFIFICIFHRFISLLKNLFLCALAESFFRLPEFFISFSSCRICFTVYIMIHQQWIFFYICFVCLCSLQFSVRLLFFRFVSFVLYSLLFIYFIFACARDWFYSRNTDEYLVVFFKQFFWFDLVFATDFYSTAFMIAYIFFFLFVFTRLNWLEK